MNIYKCLALAVFCCLVSFELQAVNAIDIPDAHATSIEKMSVFVKAKCKTNEEKLLTIQTWISKNITYDFSVSGKVNMPFDLYQQDEAEARRTFQSRRAVCAGFSNLFAFLANKVGVKVFCIGGFAKTKNLIGPHMWCAYISDGVPYIIDPTWTSGSCNYTTKKYEKEFNPKYFMTSPDSVKYSHFPNDPLFQFSEHPLTFSQQEKGEAPNENENPYFNWQDSLALYLTQNEIARNEAYLGRINRFWVEEKGSASNAAVEIKAILQKVQFDKDQILYNTYVDKCRQIPPKVSDLHNWIVDTKYMNHSVETIIRDSLEHMNAFLDDADAKFKSIKTKEMASFVKDARKSVVDEKKRISICLARLKERKKQMEKFQNH